VERVEFASKKGAERFVRAASREGFLVEQVRNIVCHKGNDPRFLVWTRTYLGDRRTYAEVKTAASDL
jgi:hypothetical protein